MSKIFLIAAVVLLLGTAGLGFLNKSKLAARTAENKQNMEAAKANAEKADKAQRAQKDAEKKLSDSTAQAEALETQLKTATAEATALKDKIVANETALNEKNAQLEKAQADLAATTGMKTAAPVAGAAPSATEEQIKTLTVERDELKAVKEGMESKLKGMESQIAGYRRDEARRAQNALKPGLRGQILAVDRNWNFVVLSLGNRNGITNNATMLVQRGGSMVGRVRITSVEPSQSIADIVPNSVPPGVFVQPGDTVIYPGGN
jgi:Tfp pilus assembly protein FimV